MGLLLALGLAAAASPRAQDDDCGKNHYILDARACSVRALDVPIGAPGAIAASAAGDVYFSVPNMIFRVAADGRLTRVAGGLTPGFAGDGGPATQALLSFPEWYPERVQDPIDNDELVAALALDASGNLYVTDAYNNRVRRIDGTGVITTVVGDGQPAHWGLWNAQGVQALDAVLWWPQGVAVDAAGTIVVADNAGMLNRVLPDGRVFSVAVNNCGNASEIGLCMPHGIAVDVGGAVYTTDDWCRIRRFGGSRPEVTYAGTSTYVDACGFSGDGGPATSAMVAWPYAVAADALGNVFVADTGNHCVRKIDAAGIITTYAGTCAVRARYDVIAGGPGYSGDGGPATAAQLDSPHGVAVDAAGNVYIADTGNFRIRKVSPDGIITTIAGNGSDIALQP